MSDNNTEIAVNTNTKNLVFETGRLDQMLKLADVMATGKITVPDHFKNSPGDLLSVIIQSVQWGMSPFAIAQQTFHVNGQLGFSAQLTNAVIQNSGAIKGRFHYEYKGEGQALQCRVGAVIAGEEEVTWGEWLKSADVTVKNSPLWKTNPKQQLGYLQVKNWARLYCPGAILGVYSEDELETIPEEKVVNPVEKTNNAPEPEVLSTDILLQKIRSMKIEEFKSIDPSFYTNDERALIRKAMTERKKQILAEQQDNVVADVKAEVVPESAKADIDFGYWEAQIRNCANGVELEEMTRTMPDEAVKKFADLIDSKFNDLF
jgi:hypothetical protein